MIDNKKKRRKNLIIKINRLSLLKEKLIVVIEVMIAIEDMVEIVVVDTEMVVAEVVVDHLNAMNVANVVILPETVEIEDPVVADLVVVVVAIEIIEMIEIDVTETAIEIEEIEIVTEETIIGFNN
jgi:hypothetical protein